MTFGKPPEYREASWPSNSHPNSESLATRYYLIGDLFSGITMNQVMAAQFNELFHACVRFSDKLGTKSAPSKRITALYPTTLDEGGW